MEIFKTVHYLIHTFQYISRRMYPAAEVICRRFHFITLLYRRCTLCCLRLHVFASAHQSSHTAFFSDCLNDIQVRLCHRMLCHENRTAVLKRKDRCLIGVNLLRNLNDLLLVKTDQRTVIPAWCILHWLPPRHCMVWLATCPILSPVISAKTFVLFCKMLCNLHHVTAHDNGQLIMRTFFVNIQAGYR